MTRRMSSASFSSPNNAALKHYCVLQIDLFVKGKRMKRIAGASIALLALLGSLPVAADNFLEKLQKKVDKTLQQDGSTPRDTAQQTSTKKPNAFGATVKNMGSVMPEWWNETTYIPPIKDGALHIRMGSAGYLGERPIGGRPNCDMAFLYVAKSGTPLTAKAMEECALEEFYIKQGTVGDKRNLNNGFERREIIEEFTKVAQQRIELFRATKKFYLRAVAVRVDTYDFEKRGFEVRANWDATKILGIGPFDQFQFEHKQFSKRDGWWETRLKGDDSFNKEFESARVKQDINTAMNHFVFEVTGAREIRVESEIRRVVEIQIKAFNLLFTRSDGRLVNTGFQE